MRAPVFLNTGQEDTLRRLAQKSAGWRFDPSVVHGFERVESGRYNIYIDSSHPVFFKVKLNYYPGFKLRDEHGKELPILDAYGGIVGYGRGRMTLTYEKGWRFLAGYVLTGLSFIAGAVAVAYRRRRRPSEEHPATRPVSG